MYIDIIRNKMKDQERLEIILIGAGVGAGIVIFILLCVYCIRQNLIKRGIIRENPGITLTKDQHLMYRTKMAAIRHKRYHKRYSNTRKIRLELAAVPKTKNPLVYNTHEVELTTPGPATKSATPVNTST
jgi:hypothetical protein